jgi:hypothetical protein
MSYVSGSGAVEGGARGHVQATLCLTMPVGQLFRGFGDENLVSEMKQPVQAYI